MKLERFDEPTVQGVNHNTSVGSLRSLPREMLDSAIAQTAFVGALFHIPGCEKILMSGDHSTGSDQPQEQG
jgi:hypothetical protein